MNELTTRLGETLNAADMLREDHRRVKALFREFEHAGDELKADIAKRAIEEIELHSRLEERCFYPALKKIAGFDAVLQALEAHHGVTMMIAELKRTPAGRRFNAKFKLLIDNVLMHIKEEEAVLIPAAETGGVDLHAMGRDMAAMKYRSASIEPRGSTFGFGALLLGAGLAAAAYALLAERD